MVGLMIGNEPGDHRNAVVVVDEILSELESYRAPNDTVAIGSRVEHGTEDNLYADQDDFEVMSAIIRAVRNGTAR